jgi:hypothetical protein
MADDNALTSRGSVLEAIAKPQVVNPLRAMSDAASAANTIYGVRQQQANEAAGEAYQGAIDPNTGEFSPNRFRTLLSQSPGAAMAAGTSLANTQNISSNQLDQALAKAKWVNAAAGAVELSGDYSDAAMLRLFQTGIANGVLTMPEVQKQIQLLPPDAAGRKQWLTEHRMTAATVEQQIQQQHGTTGSQTGPGGVTQGYVQQPASKGGGISVTSQAGAPQGLDPSQTAAYQQWLKSGRDYPDPANPTVTKHGTNETFLKDSGVPDQYVYPGGAPATPGTQPGTASPLGTGRLPPALQNPNKPQATPAPAPVATPAPSAGVPFGSYTIGGSGAPATTAPAPASPASVATPAPVPSPAGTGISGPTPAQAATAAATKAQGALGPPEFQRHATEDTQAQNQQAVLGNMLADTSQFTTGPLAGVVGKVRNMAGNLGLNINTDAQSAKESFNKLAAGLANAQGAGSDARLNVNISANPHEELSPAGVDLILRQLQGNSDYIRARASLAAKYPDKANYPAFQESIKELDPRVFQYERMQETDKVHQKSTYLKAMDPKDQRAFMTAHKWAEDKGLVPSRPGG